MQCHKCKTYIKGGFNPTGFMFPPCSNCFDKNIEKINICRSCYELFWKEFSQMTQSFIEEFFYGRL